jgi:ferritin-like metal-binding protein YciE
MAQSRDERNMSTLQRYVSDMMALESHIEEALDRQLAEVKEHNRARLAVHHFHTMVKGHRDGLKLHLQTIGGGEARSIKSAVAALAGVAAGVLNWMRTEPLSKTLRDDYTAFNLAAIGYSMLHATAHYLGHEPTASLAERYLREYTAAVQEINQLMPDVVAWELRRDGHVIDEQMVSHAVETINRCWKETAPGHAARPAA